MGLGTHLLHVLQGSRGQSRPVGLWGQSGVWMSGTGQTPLSPLCVLLHGPAPLGVSPHLHAPHRQGCLKTDDSIWAACLSSGAGLGEPLGDDARIRNPPDSSCLPI